MRTRFTWIVAILALVAIGVLMACGSKYNSSYNGLVIAPSQGSAVMQSFSLNLSNGHTSQINNVNGPPTPGLPTAVILDPPGAYAYVIVYQNAALSPSATGIATFKIASDGKMAYIATTLLTNPVAITMDSAGKFLFVANGSEGTISAFAISSNASLTEVAGSPFALPLPVGGQSPSALALTVTPTVFPPLYSYCSGFTAPTTESLYVADSVNYLLLNYSVASTGTLTLVPYSTTQPGIPTGPVPSGVAVEPCNRFAYVANSGPNNAGNSISAYTICSTVSVANSCYHADYSLLPVVGSPYPAGDNPGPMAADAYGNFLYAVNTGSNNISGYKISPTNGALTPLIPATVATNIGPNSIAIRSDDTFMFVADLVSATISQYAITPATGELTPIIPPITTFDYPSGVAVTQTGNP
jgi:DNA-binding beta-propeller fold protein YncE